MISRLRSSPRILAAAASAALALSAPGADWPCFHGPRRDNCSDETGLLAAWPEGGPALLWTAADLGRGYSSVSVASGRIFTAGMTNRQTHVIALDLDGRPLWRSPNGGSWEASAQQPYAVAYAGARSTPTVDGDTVYHLADLGRLAAFDARTGEERWHVELREAFGAPLPKYGYTESVLVIGDRLFCRPGGPRAYMAALDKRTGRTLWVNTSVADEAGFGSPVPAALGGVDQLVMLSSARVLAVRPDTGATLWQHPFANKRDNNATDAVIDGERVFVSSGYGCGSALLKPAKQADGLFTVTPAWTTNLLDNHHGGVVRVDGHVYGAGHEAKGWFCLELATGRAAWQAPGKGSLTYADNRLYCLEEDGTMNLIRADPARYDVVSSFRVPRGGEGAFWAHPVVCGGRLYVRHADRLYAYDLRGAETPPMHESR